MEEVVVTDEFPLLSESNTHVSATTIAQWRSLFVIGQDKKEYSKHSLVELLMSPDGLNLSKKALLWQKCQNYLEYV